MDSGDAECCFAGAFLSIEYGPKKCKKCGIIIDTGGKERNGYSLHPGILTLQLEISFSPRLSRINMFLGLASVLVLAPQ